MLWTSFIFSVLAVYNIEEQFMCSLKDMLEKGSVESPTGTVLKL